MAPAKIGFLAPCIRLPHQNKGITRSSFAGAAKIRAIPVHRRSIIIETNVSCTTPKPMVMSATSPTTSRSAGRTLVEGLITLFPVWAVGASALAYSSPQLFIGIGPLSVRLALAGVMLSTGLSLTRKELSDAAARPVALSFGLMGCFIAMPAIAWILAQLFGITGTEKAGLLLVGVVSGGQMSNLCTHIARGDTAISVAMTTASTLAAAFALPLLAKLLLQATVPVDAMALAVSTASFVLAPVLIGAALSSIARPIRHGLPLLGIILVLILIAGPVAQTASVIAGAFHRLALPVTLLHIIGGFLGYSVSRIVGRPEGFARAMGFETGFKSPALSFVLAQAHFADPGVALASAVSIVTLAPLGALFAVLLRFFPPKELNERTNNNNTKPTQSVRSRRLAPKNITGARIREVKEIEEIDTVTLQLGDDEKLRVEKEPPIWRVQPVNVTDVPGIAPPDDKTRFRISIRNRPDEMVFYSALTAKLNLLRRRGFIITGIQRLSCESTE